MIENEAIKIFNDLLDVPCEMIIKYDSVINSEKKQALVRLRTAEEIAISALEKQIAKKPMFNGANWYRCANGCEIHKKQFEKDWYCPKCGQKLDWSEE